MPARITKYHLSVAAVLSALAIALAIAMLTGYRYGLYSLEAGVFILTGAWIIVFVFLVSGRGQADQQNPVRQNSDQSSLFDFQNAIYKSSIVSRADKTGAITFVNDNFVAISGYSADELIGRNHRLINSGYHPHSFWVTMWKTIASGRIWRQEVRNKAKDGSYYWVDTFVMPFLNEDGSVREFLSIRNDITERKRNEEEIKKLSLVASKTSNAVTITDASGAVEWVNDSFVQITGYSFDDVKGKNMRMLQGPETDPAVVKRIGERLRQGNAVSEELINYTRQGRKFWVKIDITPIYDKDRSIRNFIAVHSDITRIKEYETSVSAIARELASLIENANVPIFGINSVGRITEWNKVASDLLGFEKHHAIGSVLQTRIFEEASKDRFESVVQQVMNGTPLGNLECAVVTQRGDRIILLMSASPRRDSNGSITGVIFVAQNITELSEYRQSLEEKVSERTRALNEALKKERELVEMKSRFISIASHEFRTPLSTISVATGMIRKHYSKLSPEDLDQKLGNIQKQVEHMTVMLDDVLLIEKANAGKLEVQHKEIMLDEFFSSLCAEVERSRGNTHHIRISKTLLIDCVSSDDKLWRSIFINLLTNAIKFSPGVAAVSLTIHASKNRVSVTVKDYGIGIPENDVRNLFEPFFRGGNVRTIQGTGLGLSIIRKSLDLLNGTITVNSTPGKGTEFHVTIPV